MASCDLNSAHCSFWKDALNSSDSFEHGMLVRLEHTGCEAPFTQGTCLIPVEELGCSVPKLLSPILLDPRLQLFTTTCCNPSRDLSKEKGLASTFCYSSPMGKCSFHASPVAVYAVKLRELEAWPGIKLTQQLPVELVTHILDMLPRASLDEVFNMLKQRMRAGLQCSRSVIDG